jgi:hypothetical protein
MEGKVDKTKKIVIIGAGPAGIHMGVLLRKHGYRYVTIYEQNKTLGGKVLTLFKNGVPNEMGACWISPEYKQVKKLAKDMRMRGDKKAGEDGKRDVINEGELQHFEDYLVRQINILHKRKPETFSLISKVQLIAAVLKYKELHKKIFGNYKYNFPPCPSDDNMQLLNCSFFEFLQNNNLQDLISFLFVSQTSQGYGFLKSVNAYYGLIWSTPELMLDYVGFAVRILPPIPTLWPDGFQTLFKRLKQQYKLNIKYNHKVKSIKRPLHNKNQSKIKIEFENKTFIEADIVLLACDLKKSLSFLDPPTMKEKNIFSKFSSMTLSTSLIEAKYIDNEQRKNERAVITVIESLFPENQGHLYTLRHSRHAVHDLRIPEKNGKDTYVGYQLLDHDIWESDQPQLEIKVLKKTLLNDLKQMNLKNIEIKQFFPWTYFPHFKTDEIVKKKYPWKILSMQGENDTFYLGNCVSFESIEHIVSYNFMIFNNFFSI